jgi:CHAT domain-containing protein
MTWGDSILGLRRAFAMAGARVLVTAHWTVGDADALAISDALYRDLPGRSAAEALARSQRAHLAAMRREWGEARPQAWGAFVAIGPMR